MKLKFTKSPILITLLFIMTLDLRFAEIFGIPFFKRYSNAVLIIAVISVLLFINTIVNNYLYNTLKPFRSYSNIFLIVLSISIALITIYSYNKYGQTMLNYLSCFKYQFYFFAMTSLVFAFTKQQGYDYFMKVLMILTIAYIILCFLNSFSYKFRGMLIWPSLQFGIRNDRLRCQAPFSLIIVLPYVFNKVFTEKLKKEKAKWIAVFALFTAFIFYICMTRMLNLAYYGFVALSLIMIPKNSNIRKTLLIIYGLIIIILVATGKIQVIIDYFQSKDENLGDSAEARLASIKYFRTYSDANPWFSMGFVLPTNDYFRAIFSGKLFAYFFDDIGIINIYLHYGIIGTIPYALYVARVIYLIIKIYFYNKSPNKAYFFGMLVFTGITQVSLSIFDGQRIMGAVLLWALCEFEAYRTSPANKPERNKRISIRRNNEDHTIQLRLDKSRRRSGVQVDGK